MHKVTLTPGEATHADIGQLRAVGFTDLEILDANNHTAHLNYTNRVANGLGSAPSPWRRSEPRTGSRASAYHPSQRPGERLVP